MTENIIATHEKKSTSNSGRRFGVLSFDPEKDRIEQYHRYISWWEAKGRLGTPDPYKIAPHLFYDADNEYDDHPAPLSLYHALEYLRKGYAVFPLCRFRPEWQPSRTPKLPVSGKNNGNNGFTDYLELCEAWGLDEYNIAIATRDLFFVLDFDGPQGQEDKKELERLAGVELDKICAFHVKTPNGEQYYCLPPRDGYHYESISGIEINGRKTHIDIRCNYGAYVVAPPSVAWKKDANGKFTGEAGEYETIGELPDRDSLTELPESMCRFFPRKKKESTTPIEKEPGINESNQDGDNEHCRDMLESSKEQLPDGTTRWKINYTDEVWERFIRYAEQIPDSHPGMEGLKKTMTLVNFALYSLDLDEEQARCLLLRWGESLQNQWYPKQMLKKIEYVKKNNKLHGRKYIMNPNFSEMSEGELMAYYRGKAELEEQKYEGRESESMSFKLPEFPDDDSETELTFDHSVMAPTKVPTEEEVFVLTDRAEKLIESVVEAPVTPIEADAGEAGTEAQSKDESASGSAPEAQGANVVEVEEEKPQRIEELSLDGLLPSVQGYIQRRHRTLSMSTTILGSLATVGSQTTSYYRLNSNDEPILLHALAVAPSGGGKTDLSKSLLSPIYALQEYSDTQYKRDLADYRAKMRKWTLDQEAKKKQGGDGSDEDAESDTDNLPVEPYRRKHIITAGGTIQGIKTLFTGMHKAGHYHSILVYASEGGGFYESLEGTSGGVSAAYPWTQAMDGEPLGDTLASKDYEGKVNIGFWGEIQNSVFQTTLSRMNTSLAQGIFSRWLYSVDPEPDDVQYLDNTYGKETPQEHVEKEWDERLVREIAYAPTQTYFLSEEAQKFHQEYTDEVSVYKFRHQKDRQIHQQFLFSVKLHSGKKVMSVACIAHLMNVAARVIDGTGTWDDVTVTGEEMEFAIRFVHHYHQHLINYLASIGWSAGLSKGNAIWNGVVRVVRFLKAQQDKITKKDPKALPYVTRADIGRNVRLNGEKMPVDFRDAVINEALDQQLIEEQTIWIKNGKGKEKQIKVYKVTPAGMKHI